MKKEKKTTIPEIIYYAISNQTIVSNKTGKTVNISYPSNPSKKNKIEQSKIKANKDTGNVVCFPYENTGITNLVLESIITYPKPFVIVSNRDGLCVQISFEEFFNAIQKHGVSVDGILGGKWFWIDFYGLKLVEEQSRVYENAVEQHYINNLKKIAYKDVVPGFIYQNKKEQHYFDSYIDFYSVKTELKYSSYSEWSGFRNENSVYDVNLFEKMYFLQELESDKSGFINPKITIIKSKHKIPKLLSFYEHLNKDVSINMTSISHSYFLKKEIDVDLKERILKSYNSKFKCEKLYVAFDEISDYINVVGIKKALKSFEDIGLEVTYIEE